MFLDNSACFIIAEAGVNHNGNKDKAYALVDIAADANVDAVKFQTFKAEKVVTPVAPKADYQLRTTDADESQMDMLQKLVLPYEWHADLKSYSESKGVQFLSTPAHDDAADFLVALGLSALKVSSADITNLPFLSHMAKLGVPLILSTGMSDISEIEQAVESIENNGCSDYALLHCLSQYPAPIEEVNLRAIITLKEKFSCAIGYSDHTIGIDVSLAAVAMGAQILEKHFTLDTSLPGPDHEASLSPEGLKSLVQAIRSIESAMGDGIKRCQPSEMNTRAIARKSLMLTRDLPAGHILCADDLEILRPDEGIAPKYFDQIVGRKLKNSGRAWAPLLWHGLE